MNLTAMRRLASPLGACRRRRVARAAATVLALVALLPSVFPYDHLLPPAHQQAQAEPRQATHAADAHEQHCHGDPASCSDAPISAGPGQLMSRDSLLVAPATLPVLLVGSTPALAGIAQAPEVRPPVRALSLSA